MTFSRLVHELLKFDPQEYFDKHGRVELPKQVFEYRDVREIEDGARNILWKVYEENNDVDLIVGIPRGSTYIWRIATDIFPADHCFIRVKSYTGVGKSSQPQITRGIEDSKVRGKKVMIVDEVADTGETLLLVLNYLKKMGAKEIITVTLDLKPWSKVTPDYYERCSSWWIVYSYESFETIRGIMEAELSFDEKISLLWRTGIPISQIKRVVEGEYGLHIGMEYYPQIPFQRTLNAMRRLLMKSFLKRHESMDA